MEKLLYQVQNIRETLVSGSLIYNMPKEILLNLLISFRESI